VLDPDSTHNERNVKQPQTARIPKIVRRYLAIAPEDFAARNGPVGDLERVLEEIARDVLEDGEAIRPGATTDGVSIDVVSAVGQAFRCEGELWLLNGGSWSVPLKATFWLSGDLESVASYDVEIAGNRYESPKGAPVEGPR
jgi:hypothetical protein